MKKFMILLLAVILAACSSAPTAAPTEPPAPTVVEPSPTPVVIVQTVVVEATQPPTVVPSPTTEPPTAVPATPTPVVVTVVVEATQPVQAVAPTSAPVDTSATSGLITMDQSLGAGWFTDMTLTKNALSLRCQTYKEITFSVKPLDANIAEVNFYYRIVDRATGSAFDWQNVGKMPPDAKGNFALVFTGDKVNANFRKPNAWLDFQFIGLSRTGGVVGRSEKIEQQVTYTLDCP
ncbi:MAG TPA: hypothetical protein VFR47_23385 [Anaerolineales bacterium]|nr:hypothetical protein [Anaerolineales bacterium]